MIDKYLIYALVDPRDGQYRYIGQSSRGMSRPLEHIKPRYYNRSKRKVYCWIRSCMNQGVVPEIKVLHYCQEDNLNTLEVESIKHYGELGHKLCNLTEGGEGARGYKPTKETIAKLQESHYGQKRIMTKKHKDKIGRKGRKVSSEQIEKCKKTVEGRIGNAPRPILRSDGVQYSSALEVAMKMEIGLSTVRKCLTEPTRLCRGFTLSYAPYFATKEKRVKQKSRSEYLGIISKQIIRSDGQVFESLVAAAKAVGANPSQVAGAIKSQYRCKTYFYQFFDSTVLLENYIKTFEEWNKKPRRNEEAKKLARERMLGTKLSLDTRIKLSASKKGKKLSKEGSISRNEKLGIKIIRSDGEIYSSKGDAARALGVDRGSITRAVKLGSFCKGYRFSLV